MHPSDLTLIPESAPFNSEQRAWMNGYLAGLMAAGQIGAGTVSAPETPPAVHGPLLFLFGSQTGSSENLTRKFAKEARARGFDSRVHSLDEFSQIDFAKERRLAIITSTYGDGDMPDNAQPFWDFISDGSAPRLEHLEFSVLALGDSNYVQFCEAGKKFDTRLSELGAQRVFPRTDCDVDYEEPSKLWFDGFLEKLGAGAKAPKEVKTESPKKSYSRKNPFPARLKTNHGLNGPGSSKDTRHLEILLGDSGLSYEVGDALGIVPTNSPDFVQEILEAAGLDGEEAVNSPTGSEVSIRKALIETCDLKPFLEVAPVSGVSAADLIAPLKKLQPRLYSISSSPKAHPGEVHLTVGVVRYELNGKPRCGVCSTFLADRVGPDTPLPIFVHPSPGFKPPVDPSVPMIMVGPGTGIAPFRAFLEERRAIGATGRNWLFFGDQKAACDFLYREELEAMQGDGFLTRLDTAFSRDQAEKVYVQNRMLEQARELWDWLESGAHFYVCGDAKRMAKDVDVALQQVATTVGGLSLDEASQYLKTLKSQKRYQRDVY
ncbi:MAG: sulfite reductase flavoprotein subunit alpha [Puniceicoccaceae bacterium]